MRKSLILVLLLAATPPLKAQTRLSSFELYGGYEYVRFNINANVSGQPPFQTFNGNCVGGSSCTT